MVQDRHIVSIILKLNRKSYALYRMVMLPMILVTPNPSNHPNLCIFVAFYFVVGDCRDL